MVLDDWVAASCCQAVKTALHLEAMRPTTVVAQRLSSALLLLQHPLLLLLLLLRPSFDPWVIFSISWRRRSWWVAAAVVEVLPCLLSGSGGAPRRTAV